jgi:hypothetical protein
VTLPSVQRRAGTREARVQLNGRPLGQLDSERFYSGRNHVTSAFAISLALLLTAAIAAMDVSASWGAAPRRCGEIQAHGGAVDGHLVAVHVFVDRGRVDCRAARQAIRDVVSGHGQFHAGQSNASSFWMVKGGWRCFPPEHGSADCIRRGAAVEGLYRP